MTSAEKTGTTWTRANQAQPVHRLGRVATAAITTLVVAAAWLTAACGTDARTDRPPAANTTQADRTPLAAADGQGQAVQLMRRYVTTINNGDLEGYVRLFAANAIFTDAGRTSIGREQIRSFGADLIRVRSRYSIVRLSGNDTRAQMVFDYSAPGVPYNLDDGRGELTASDGLIRTLRLD